MEELQQLLQKNYSIRYNKDQWLFKNPNDYRLFVYIFSEYVKQVRLSNSSPEHIDMYTGTILSTLNISDTTYRKSLNNLVDLCVITRKGVSQTFRFNSSYIFGLIALLNNSTSDDENKKIREAFDTNDLLKLEKLGYKPAAKISLPSASPSILFQNNQDVPEISTTGSQNEYDVPKNGMSDTNYCGHVPENGTGGSRKHDYIQEISTIDTRNYDLYSSDALCFPDKWSGDIIFRVSEGEIEKVDCFDDKNNHFDSKNSDESVPENGISRTGKWYITYRKMVPINKYIINRNETEKVLFEKNQNEEVEPDGSINLGNSPEDEKYVNCFDKYGKIAYISEKEYLKIIEDKRSHSVVQSIIKSFREEYEEGVRVDIPTFCAFYKNLMDDSFPDIKRESGEELDDIGRELKEIRRFCGNPESIFPFFYKDGGEYVINYIDQPRLTLEERKVRFEALHNSVEDYLFTEEDVNLPDIDKKELIAQRFNEKFELGEQHMRDEMRDFIVRHMIDIGLFNSFATEYNSYNILEAFQPNISLKCDMTAGTCENMRFDDLKAYYRDSGIDSKASRLKARKSMLSTLESDSNDLIESIMKFKLPKISITQDERIPSSVVIPALFRHLGYKDGDLLCESDCFEILNTVIKRYGVSGIYRSAFDNISAYMEFFDSGVGKVKLRNIETPLENSIQSNEDTPLENTEGVRKRRERN